MLLRNKRKKIKNRIFFNNHKIDKVNSYASAFNINSDTGPEGENKFIFNLKYFYFYNTLTKSVNSSPNGKNFKNILIYNIISLLSSLILYLN